MPRIHALLVGINEYTAISPLHGCVADIESVEALLRSRITAPDGLALQVLRNAEATRAAIIAGFTAHLGQAGPGDIALFYFCGHGSDEASPEEWRGLAIGGRNQTIVPVDARVGDTFDIADKELSALIHGVAATGAQVVVVLDSCHSGDATRSGGDGAAVAVGDNGVPRMTAAATGRTRTLADYHEAARTLYDPALLASGQQPAPAHIAIAACRDDQLAKEFPVSPPPRRGVFTMAFVEAVTALGPTATYADLITVIRARVRANAKDQVPNITVSGTASAATLFLGGTAGRIELTLDHADGTWWLSSGAIDGIVAPAGGAGGTTIDIHPRGSLVGGRPSVSPLATGTVTSVDVHRSAITVGGSAAALDTGTQYHCTISAMTPPALQVTVAGPDTAGVAAVRSALTGAAGRSALVERADGHPTAVTVQVEGGTARLHGADGTPLSGAEVAVDATGLARLTNACTHLARWHGTRDRSAPGSTFNDTVLIEVLPALPGETTLRAGQAPLEPGLEGIALSYAGDAPPRVQFRLRNTSNARLYVALYDLTDRFACRVMFDGWLAAGDIRQVYAKPTTISIPEGRETCVDLLKLFAAKDDFLPHTLLLPDLFAPESKPPKPGSTLATRAPFTLRVATDTSVWGTTMLRMVTRR
ncbi:MAG: caspase family protein [Gemmatimonadaceae bacterium]|nr:caspase family protein [Gemmatimonadaceae bacterium]